MAAVNIQHKNCLQSTLRKKIINTLFAGLGRSVLGKTVPPGLGYGPRPLLFAGRDGSVLGKNCSCESHLLGTRNEHILYMVSHGSGDNEHWEKS